MMNGEEGGGGMNDGDVRVSFIFFVFFCFLSSFSLNFPNSIIPTKSESGAVSFDSSLKNSNSNSHLTFV